ncbi:MAG: hypothetical protein AAF899_16920 [Pseudomonadota bacterium]
MKTLIKAALAALALTVSATGAQAVTLNFADLSFSNTFVSDSASVTAPRDSVDGSIGVGTIPDEAKVVVDVSTNFPEDFTSVVGTLTVLDELDATVETQMFSFDDEFDARLEVIVMSGYSVEFDLLVDLVQSSALTVAARLTAVPVPPAFLLLGSGLVGVLMVSRRKAALA